MGDLADKNNDQASAGGADGGVPSSDNAFGDTVVTNLYPVVQLDFSAGLGIEKSRVVTRQDGNAAISSSALQLTSGTGSFSYAAVESHSRARYRPGQGVLARWTAIYDTPTEGIRAFAGLNSGVSALQVGYSGSRFGINHQANSAPHIFTFDVTVASTTAETASFIFSNETGPNIASVPLTNNASLVQTANEIAKADWSLIHYHGYNVQSSGSTVTFVHRDPEGHSESISFTATTMSGAFNEDVLSGDHRNDHFTPQSEWNIDIMDGTGPSGMKLNHQFGNVYQVAFQYLGYGNSVFSIENENSGKMTPVHQLKYVNKNTDLVLVTPNIPVQWLIEHTGSTDTTSKFIKGGSGAVFNQGYMNGAASRRFSTRVTYDSLTTTKTHVLSLKSLLVFNEIPNLGTIRPVTLNITSDGARGFICDVYRDSTIANPDWYEICSGESAVLATQVGSLTDLTDLIFSTSVSANSTQTIDLREHDITMHGIPDQDTINIVLHTFKTTTDAIVSITWEEIL